MIQLLNTITTGDARILSAQIPDESIDLIFTDPPYLREYLPLYEWLSAEGARVLKPGGFLLAYAGVYHKQQTMEYLSKHLDYYWDFVSVNLGNSPIMWQRKIISRHKSILAFVKSKGLPRCNVISLWVGSGEDKRYHIWGQDESTARYYIDCFSSSRGVIWDPFCGGGTTPAVCKVLDRSCIAFEIDPATAAIARKRLEMTQPMLMPEQALQMLLESEATA
jgi:site-specific DNA-methyltransferase (adenine-specific)